jgi:hypothetical protein
MIYNSVRFSLLVLLCAVVALNAEANEEIVRTAQLKTANVELASTNTTLLLDDPPEPSLAEQLYQMVFKRSAKSKDEPKKTEEGRNLKLLVASLNICVFPDPKSTTTTPAPSEETTTAKAHKVEGKHEKPHHSGHKKHKHKHHHKHHKSDNGTEIDWHSIG